MRRFSFGFLIVLALLVIVAACAPKTAPTPPVAPAPTPAAIPTPTAADEWQKVLAAAKREGKVSMYTFVLTGDVGNAIAAAFEQTYGIKVETVTGVGTVLIERIQSERAGGKYLADTLDTAISLLFTAKERGLTQSWGNLPVFAETGVWIRPPKADPEGHIIQAGVINSGPWVNTTLVKSGEEPKTLKDLLDPRWGGQKIAIGSPVTDPQIIYAYVAKLIDDDFLTRLAKNNLRLTPTVRDAIGAVVRGESAIVFPTAESIAAPFLDRGAPIKPIDPAEGVVSFSHGATTMVKDAPHPNAARLFANWMLTKEGQTAYNKARSTAPIRKDVTSFLHPTANIEYKKAVWLGLTEMLLASKLQREGTVAKLMGIEK